MNVQHVHRGVVDCLEDLRTRDRLLSSIHKISSLLTRSISLDTVLTLIVKETTEVFGFTRLAIFLTDRDRELLECRYIHGFNPQDTERALQLPYRLKDHDCVETRVALYGKTVYVKDYESDPALTPIDREVSRIMRRVSTIAVPLKIKSRIIGLITADKDDIKLTLTKRDINILTTFANQASIFIENARLQEQNKRKIKQLLTLQEISKKTSSALNLNKLCQVICTSARKISKAKGGLLYLFDEDGKSLTIAAARGVDALETRSVHFKNGVGLVGRVAKSGKPILVDDVNEDPRYRSVFTSVVSQLAVPLNSDKRTIGVLQVTSDVRAAFSEDDLKLLLIYAGHAASLIRNARLYGQVMTERNFRENILESSPNSMITINLKKEVTSINRRTEELFRLRRKDVLGVQVGELFPAEIVRIITLALDDHAVVNRKEIHQIGRDGTPVILGITSSLLRTHQGSLIGAMLIVRDLTEEKKTEELIRRLDRLTSLGQVSAGIAHEIRNPLTSINFNVQLLAKKGVSSDAARRLLDDTQEGIDRIRTLVKGMLGFAKPSLPSLQNDSLPRVIEGAVSLMDSQLKKKKVKVALELQHSLPLAVFDAHQIQQVLVNLLLNSMEAMPEGGTISIAGVHEKGSKKQRDHILLRISDQGCGIPKEHLSRIFNPFFTTKAEGTGLGLSIVHKIMEQHGASIDVISEQNHGTTFILRFPTRLCKEYGYVPV
ncbi:MAG: GAF domain-containing protein [Desulfobulbus sp.]|nr:GAF domain-containing protein [Desulfobulbus sp.]